MFIKLFILFAVIPIAELYVLLKVGALIGAFYTVIIILATATLGAYLAKTQGFTVIKKINSALKEGRAPAKELLDGLFVLAGGILLLTPGFVTDFMGLSMLIPPLRSTYIRITTKIIQTKLNTGNWNTDFFSSK